jgi:hypothetical protein
MSEAKRDQNHITTMLAYNDVTGLTEPVRIDDVTNSILIDVYHTSALTPSDITIADRDGNHVHTVMGYNETTQTTEALRCNDSGFIHVLLA